ncbi:MAG TPA: multifunctional CCA addition/repair protein [Halothiobacillaceae bacterium]|nr:multifunctional CCA addition/repair protein [Halothiobacillaceae bacterium]
MPEFHANPVKLQQLEQICAKAYLVGGAVRDQLLGLEVTDKDWVVTGTTPEQMTEAGFKPVGSDFPVFLHPKTGEEYALARTERKEGRGYTGFSVCADPTVRLEDDLARRDLTINAIARAPNGELIDPFDGQHDLAQRQLRHVSAAFSEDPLRVLRVARFAAKLHPFGFTLAPETRRLMVQMSQSGELSALTPERVWLETQKALSCTHPQRYFEILREVGALPAVFPEIDALFGVPQPEQYHPEIDSGIHTLLVLKQTAALTTDINTRFAALCHDLGKACTPKAELPRHVGHEQRGEKPVRALCARLRVSKATRELALATTLMHGRIHRACEMRPATLVDLLDQLDAYRRWQRVLDILTVCHADTRGRPGYEQNDYPQAERIKAAFEICQAISPQALIKAGLHGAEIGKALREKRIAALKQAQI